MLAVALGTVPQWLTVISIVGAALGAYFVMRGGGGSAMTTLRDANEVLEKRVRELETQGKIDAATISELKGRTDVSVAITPLVAWSTTHEQRAQERHLATLRVLDLIASRLGPDDNHAG